MFAAKVVTAEVLEKFPPVHYITRGLATLQTSPCSARSLKIVQLADTLNTLRHSATAKPL